MNLEQYGKAVKEKIEKNRRDPQTAIITTGHIIKAPFNVSFTINNNFLQLTIKGQNDEVTLKCNKVVISKFRPDQISFLTFDQYNKLSQQRTVAFLTPAFLRILDSFPPGSIFSTEELYAKIRTRDGESQRHARRRWKELKYDYGFDVDRNEADQKYWRGHSVNPIKDPVVRPKDDLLQKAYLLVLAKESINNNSSNGLPTCNYCNIKVRFTKHPDFEGDTEEVGLLDHRRPVFQGGDDTLDNLQIFCQTCNNKKNSTCRACPHDYKCDTCMFAYPEKYKSRRIVLFLEPHIIASLQKKSDGDLENFIVNKLKEII